MTKTTKIIIGAIVAVVIIGGIWRGTVRKPASTEIEKNPIKIGVILPLSGSAATYGDKSQKGIEIALQELKKKYPNLDLYVYYEDSFYTAQGGVDAYQKLRSINSVDAVITGASQVSLSVLPLSTKDNILQMAIFSSNQKYTVPNDLSFRVSNKNEIETKKLANFLKEKGFKKLGILYLNNEFGVGFIDSLKNEISKENIKIDIVGEEGYSLDATDFKTNLLKLSRLSPDAVFMVGIAKHYGLILKQAKEMGINSQFISMRSAEDPTLLDIAGGNANDLIYSYPFNSNSSILEIKNFVNSFKEKYKVSPEAYSAEAYEGFKLIVMAFAECDKNYDCIKKYLFNLKDYNSVFGDLKFDENGDVYYDFFLKTIKNGQFVLLENF